jgi:hypothetical protein
MKHFARIDLARVAVVCRFQLPLSNDCVAIAVFVYEEAIGTFAQNIEGRSGRIDLEVRVTGNYQSGKTDKDAQLDEIFSQ